MNTVQMHTMPERDETYWQNKQPIATQTSSISLLFEQKYTGIEFRKPSRAPIDIEFDNISYTVDVGNILKRG